MRIPLDYYRILGLTVQASAGHLYQAYQDRIIQLPRREYTGSAIAAYRELIDRAYEVLGDPAERRAYNQAFLQPIQAEGIKPGPLFKTAQISPGTGVAVLEPETENLPLEDVQLPSIEIEPDQLGGALLLLQELGEYEAVLGLGNPYLKSDSGSPRDVWGERDPVHGDVVLTVALAYLELGREQYEHRRYEKAAESLRSAQELLLREGLFPELGYEICEELQRLRPYRILELLALPLEAQEDRQQGLQLLTDMFQERGGIDGTGNDGSGLDVDALLRFIQQLRDYLTAAEQEELFLAEAQRPSAVAIYLATYGLIARGFTEYQPALVHQAKRLLMRLASHQDVFLEQAVCALLLAQTEEAIRVLTLSQEYEPLAFIQHHSQQAPDLLPGLCLYTENWLQTEVLPYFRDLKNRTVALNDYFANETVQDYLEALPSETIGIADPQVTPQIWPPQPIPKAMDPSKDTLPKLGDAIPWDKPSVAPLPPQRSQPPEHYHTRIRGTLVAVGCLLALGIGARVTGFHRLFWHVSPDKIPLIALDQPLITIPTFVRQDITPPELLSPEVARDVIQTWLAVKLKAFGPNRSVEDLQKILTGPLLINKQRLAEAAARQEWYVAYKHGAVQINSIEASKRTPNQATVEAEIQEAATYFDDGRPLDQESYLVRVQYSLVRVDGDWQIQNIVVGS